MGSTLTVDNIVGATTAANVKLPAGGIVGYKSVSTATNTDITSSSFSDLNGMTITYSAKYSTSVLLFLVSYHVFIHQQTGQAWGTAGVKLINSTDSATVIADAGYGIGANISGNDDRMMLRGAFEKEYDVNSTDSKTYKLQGARLQGSGTMSFNHSSYGMGGSITVLEIAQ